MNNMIVKSDFDKPFWRKETKILQMKSDTINVHMC